MTNDEIRYADGTGMIRLISHGWRKAVPAATAKVGDRKVYNYGGTAPIVAIEDKGGWRHITVEENGKQYTNRMRPTSLVVLQ